MTFLFVHIYNFYCIAYMHICGQIKIIWCLLRTLLCFDTGLFKTCNCTSLKISWNICPDLWNFDLDRHLVKSLALIHKIRNIIKLSRCYWVYAGHVYLETDLVWVVFCCSILPEKASNKLPTKNKKISKVKKYKDEQYKQISLLYIYIYINNIHIYMYK